MDQEMRLFETMTISVAKPPGLWMDIEGDDLGPEVGKEEHVRYSLQRRRLQHATMSGPGTPSATTTYL
jgi:hypothetical protein